MDHGKLHAADSVGCLQSTNLTTMPALDASLLRPNRISGRHESIFSTSRFRALKQSISATGKNVIPVCVRMMAPEAYEIVYGVLRVRACAELGLPVNALVSVNLSEPEAIIQMYWENESFDSFSDYEKGEVFRKALECGLFASQRKLAEGISVDATTVSRCLVLATLPVEALQAFGCVLSLRAAWAPRLAEAVSRDPERFKRHAANLSAAEREKTDAAIYAELTRF